MKTNRLTCILGFLAATQVPANAAAWLESGDAGDSLVGAQQTLGTGALTQITGTLPSDTDLDIYQIMITNPALFQASCNGAQFTDPDLWLFNSSGMGVCQSNIVSAGQTLLTNAYVTIPGLYYIAISNNQAVAQSAGGDIWTNVYSANRAPDGPGAAQPFTGWSSLGLNNGTTSYTINLQGAEFSAIPEPSVFPLMGLGGLLAFRRRGARGGR